jgi:hypothetical protein
MISETYLKILEDANRQLALYFEKLKKARTSRDKRGIQQAEMDYFQALQRLLDKKPFENPLQAHSIKHSCGRSTIQHLTQPTRLTHLDTRACEKRTLFSRAKRGLALIATFR